MIAAPGFALATGRFGSLARVLNTFAAQRRDGLLPASFPHQQDEPDFGSIDAPLWFILAVEWFGRARRDAGRPSPLLASVRAILSSYHRGTRFGIGVAQDGLLSGGVPSRALTWMDSMVDGQPAVPRIGKAVEVNALWHAALKAAARMERLAEEHSRARELEAEAWHVARKFQSLFWSPKKSISTTSWETTAPTRAFARARSSPSPFRRTCCRRTMRELSTGPSDATC